MWTVQCDATTGREISRATETLLEKELFFIELTPRSSNKFHSKND